MTMPQRRTAAGGETVHAVTVHKHQAEPGVLTKAGLEQSAEQLKLLEQYVQGVLHKDEDYGTIPGTNGKPTLLKPGAANITAAFMAHAEPTIDTEILDPDKGFVAYRIHVDIVSNTGAGLLARGYGSCTSYEAKYRYRNAQPKCPECGRENIRKSKGGGFYCWPKTGGCGANFHQDDQRISGQAVGRVKNEDPLEQANTILKIAIKRAEVDAAMRLPGVARFFTQDLEDTPPTTEINPAQPSTKPAEGRKAPPPSNTQPEPQSPAGGQTDGQSEAPTPVAMGRQFAALCRTLGYDTDTQVKIIQSFGVKKWVELSPEQMRDALVSVRREIAAIQAQAHAAPAPAEPQ